MSSRARRLPLDLAGGAEHLFADHVGQVSFERTEGFHGRLALGESVIWRGPETPEERGVGPLWAEAGWELHESWMEYHNRGGLVPFSQIHGHSAIVSYNEQTWHTPGRVRQRSTVDWEARQFRVRVIVQDQRTPRGSAVPAVLGIDAREDTPSRGAHGRFPVRQSYGPVRFNV